MRPPTTGAGTGSQPSTVLPPRLMAESLGGSGRIAVGTPTGAFTVRAPSKRHQRRAYRADTVVDAWTAGAVTVRAASVRGDGHRFEGAPRQDDFALGYHEDSGTVVVAVSDGVSSATDSAVGATAACRYTVGAALDLLDRGQCIQWGELVRGAAWAVVEAHRQLTQTPRDPSAAERYCACTLIAAAIRPGKDGCAEVSGAGVGDSALGVLAGDRIDRLTGGKPDDDSGIVAQAVVGLPRVPAELAEVRYTQRAGEVLLIGTDGIWDPLGAGTGLLGDLLRAALGTGPPDQVQFCRIVDFSRETFDDDRTLVAVWLAGHSDRT